MSLLDGEDFQKIFGHEIHIQLRIKKSVFFFPSTSYYLSVINHSRFTNSEGAALVWPGVVLGFFFSSMCWVKAKAASSEKT